MIAETRIRPAGSVLAITGDEYAEMPEVTAGSSRLWANEWCVFVGTLTDADGETHLQISDDEFMTDLPLVFDGFIAAPSGRVSVSDAHLTEFGAVPVSVPNARVRVWTNHPSEPTEVLVAIGNA